MSKPASSAGHRDLSQWPVWIGIGALWLFGRLPFTMLKFFARILGRIVEPVLKTRGKVAATNLALCFPDLSELQRRELLQKNLRNSGFLLAEFAFAWCASRREVDRLSVTFSNLKVLDQALEAGKGVLLVGAHFSHLELCGRLLCHHTGAPIAGMYRPHKTAAMEYFVKQQRLKYAHAMFKRDELRAAIRWLKAGKILWYAPDQDYKRGDTVFAPFFGVPASSLTATHQLAKMTGAAVIGFRHRRTEIGYAIELIGPMENFPSVDATSDTARVNAMIESAIRLAPEQYLWLHQRFKSRPEGMNSVY